MPTRFNITLESSCEDFTDNTTVCLVDVLTTVRRRVEQGRTEGVCLDVNGNTIGSWSLTASR